MDVEDLVVDLVGGRDTIVADILLLSTLDG